MDRVRVTPEAAALLGKSAGEIAAMSIEKFSNLCFDRGLRIDVSFGEVREGDGHLLITAEPPARSSSDNA